MKQFASLLACACGLASSALGGTWTVTKAGTVLQVNYGTGTANPQVFALHLDSSYYRLNTGPGCGWGTSVVLWPVYWSGGRLNQGGPVTSYTHNLSGANLVLRLAGKVGAINSWGTIVLYPPIGKTISGKVYLTNTGNPLLDNRPGEAFKPVMFSSMNINAKNWDSYNVLTEKGLFWYPASGWIINPVVSARTIQVTGGNSDWKKNAPTITVIMDKARQVTGWVTPSTDPNDDNVGVWGASAAVETSYSYDIIATSN